MTESLSLIACRRVAISLCLAASAAMAAAQTPADADRAITAMRVAAGAELGVTRSPRTRLATFIKASRGGAIPVLDRTAATAEARALSFIGTYGSAFGLSGAEDVDVVKSQRDALGLDHVRLRQTLRGVPVTGGELIVHLRGDRVLAANGKTLDGLESLNVIPATEPQAALDAARAFAVRRLNAPDAGFSPPRLEILSRGLLDGRDFPTRLVWFVEATGLDLREFIWIDAQSNTVLLHFSQLTEAKNRAIYDANSLVNLPGTLIRSEGQAPVGNATLPDAIGAYNYSGDTYDYYFTQHGRDSFDGLGAQIRSSIKYCPDPGHCPYANAFWNGTQMVYGLNFASADDVVAHEITHAVTERTANLFYYMQAGALNESFSDIFGETVDQTNGAGNDAPAVKWQMGEDLTGVGVIRNMMDPTLKADPGKMSDPQFVCELDPVIGDSGGVHSNSGIPNHAYALMVDGGTYNAQTVSGIGLTKAGKIQYRALTQYLVSSSDFLDNYNALQQSCSDLVGTAGITSGDCAEVKKALDAVQMANTWACTPSQPAVPAVCSAGQYPVNSFFDNFESGLGNWTRSGTAGTWFLASDGANAFGGTVYATSGVDSLWGYDQPQAALSTVALNSNLSIPAGARLQFDHSYGFEHDASNTYDGGVVEYSIDGGANWLSLSSLYASGANYGGTMFAGTGNVLGGQSAFVKDSYGYTASQYNLASLAGQTQVRFRFRVASDSFVDDFGWFIDDFRVYQCVANTPPTLGAATSSNITTTSADLGGNVTSDGGAAISTRGFVHSLQATNANPVIGGTGVSNVVVSGTTGVFGSGITGLLAGSTYAFKAYATNAQGTTYSSVATFTTLLAPSVSTGGVSGVTATSATLSGTVNPNGNNTTAQFVYGVAPSPSIVVAASPAPGSGSSPVSVSATLSGLTCSTTYQYRLTGASGAGTGTGLDATFTTAACASPTLAAATSSNITTTSADLGGNVTSDGGAAISVRGFVHSLQATNANPLIGGAGVSNVVVSGTTGVFGSGITGLLAGSTYAFKAYATNAQGTTYSSVATFTTLLAPSVTTGGVSGVTTTSATLSGTVNPNGNNTTAQFVYGVAPSPSIVVAATPAPGSGSAPISVGATISGLICATTYQYRLTSVSSAGTGAGADRTFTTAACGPTIFFFTASNVLVAPSASSTLSWSVSSGAALTLNGAAVTGPAGLLVVNPGATTSYTLIATDGTGSSSRTVTVSVSDGTSGLAAPVVTSPGSGQTVAVTGVGFTWTGLGSASGYDIRVLDSTTGLQLFSGLLVGGASTSTLISLPAGGYQFAVRACAGGFASSRCGAFGTVSFTVSPAAPTGAPTVTFPIQGANLTSSTQTLSWTAVTPNPALSGLTYEVLLRDLTAGTTALQITVPSPNLSTIFTMKSSTQYELMVRACQAGCGPFSTPVTFAVTLPPAPTSGPTGVTCSVAGGNSLTCNWNAVTNADAYQIQVVQAPPAGPGGGALTVAAKQVSATTVTLPVPAGAATVFIAACNGDGCGPNTTVPVTAAGPNPSLANLGTPMAGTVVTGPGVLFTWNRVPGDDGSSTSYRLFVQDLSRQATALDVFTTTNFYSAFFKAEGARYDALVVSNPGQPSQATGPSQGFNVAGASATAPTMVSPAHNSSVSSGNIQLGWSPVPGATLYQYFVAVLGQGSATVQGVTPGLLAQAPLAGTGGGTVFSGIVRACPAAATCVLGSDVGWGPWSNAPGGPGVTNFTVVP